MSKLADKISKLREKMQAVQPTFSGGKQLILSRKNPTAIIRLLTVGDDWFPIIGIHAVTKASNNNFTTYLCPTLTDKEEKGFVEQDICPICALIKTLTNDKVANSLTPKTRVAIKVIEFNIEDGAYIPSEIKYLIVPTDVGIQLLDYVESNPDIVDIAGGMLVRVTKHYDTKYPTYSFEVLKSPVDGKMFITPLVSEKAKEFLANNDIKITDALPIATPADVADIATGDSAPTFAPVVSVPDVLESPNKDVVNGKTNNTSAYAEFMNKITANK